MIAKQIEAAVNAVKENPEHVDALIWWLLQPEASRSMLNEVVDELSDVYATQHMCLAELVFWFVDGEPGLMKQLKDTGAMPTLSTADAHEWLASLAWLIIKAQGQTSRMDTSNQQPNWLSRSKEGFSQWYGLGISSQRPEGSDGRESFRISVYYDAERVEEAFLYRVCCFNRTEDWKGLSHLGIEHEWEDCLFYPEEDDYDDYYE